ncbi:adenosine deaminase [Nocardioides sp. WL0053]|uniref:Adenosine deaminase n=1 Tax=Nocardioides jiangsuensis TaxID=2866161 RepID=A0ABS7RHY1_9ACTN|nr:adenosine deaminase [Nocardioides jiangsuensis]MBY9074653.1 adenosine deaminase [Nocardioides jiangsuensis]
MVSTNQTPHSPSPYAAFIAGLPKAELHVHHVGSASPETVAKLAARHPGRVPSDPAALAEYFAFRDFAHFVEVYLSVVDLIVDGEDVRRLTYEVAREMAGQNIRYAELTMTPYTSELRGIAPELFVEAIEDARVAAERDHGIALQWIFDIPGESGLPAAEGTLRAALDHGPSSLVGFGLGGPEIGVPRPQFKPYFDQARAAGLRSVPHAGETTGPQTVWDALNDLGAERIGHGTSAAQDPALLEHLAAHGIPLEVCPTSNIATRAVEHLDVHPIRAMVQAGVTVTVNSDDPPMFGTHLNREYEIAARLLDLDEAGIAGLAHNAVDASFMDDAGKAALSAEIDGYLVAHTTGTTAGGAAGSSIGSTGA